MSFPAGKVRIRMNVGQLLDPVRALAVRTGNHWRAADHGSVRHTGYGARQVFSNLHTFADV